ncbi:MAG TPA: YdhK family protein, partial [Candidatus Avamphibacillus sp.]|nr:YdhK family protein [Candidatus Avamphibacillus sp.]
MKGMEGATAEIESSEKTTVYMIDYTPTTGGEEVKNHKWVTDSELSAE